MREKEGDAKNTIFETADKYINTGGEEIEDAEKSESQEENKVEGQKKVSTMSVAVKKALIKSIFDDLAKAIQDDSDVSCGKLKAAYNILQINDPYIEIFLKQLKENSHIREKLGQLIKLLKFTEIGRFLGNEALVSAFNMEPMMVYHNSIRHGDF